MSELENKMPAIGSFTRRALRIGILLLATSTACAAVITLIVMVSRARLPYQIDYEEGNILNAAVRIVHGMTIYPDPHSWPSVMNPYGPVGYEIVSWVVRFGGVQLPLARMMMIGFTVLCCILIGVIAWRETRSMAAAVAFGAMLLTFPVVNTWAMNVRVDMMALAFSLAAIAVLMLKEKWWWASTLLIIAAVFTKHTSLAAPAACVAWLWLKGERRRAKEMIGLGLVLGMLGFGYMQWRTHGFFLFYMTGTHADLFSWHRYFEQLYYHLTGHGLLSLLVLVSVIVMVAKRRPSLPVLYVLVAILTTVTIGKAGSNSNHLIELSAAMCLGAAAGWKDLASFADRRATVAVSALLVLLAATIVNNAVRQQFTPRDSEYEAAYTYLKNFKGQRVIAENMAAAVLAGKTLWISNPYVYTQLVRYGGWSDADLQRQLQKREVDMVLFGKDQEWSPGMLQALDENYELARTFTCRTMPMAYVPKTAAAGK